MFQKVLEKFASINFASPLYNQNIQNNEQHFKSYRNRSRYDILLCWSLAKRQSRNYCKWSRKQDNPFLCSLYRNIKAYRRFSQKSDRQESSQHCFRRKKTYRKKIHRSSCSCRYETLALQSLRRSRWKTKHCHQVQRLS